MTLEKLRSLYEAAKNDKHYQYRSIVGTAQYEALVNASYNRLTEIERKKVQLSCQKYFSDMGGYEAKCIRFMAQTNLFFMCKLLEKYSDVSDMDYTFNDKYWVFETNYNTHEWICNEFFVHKNPAKETFQDFAKSYSDLKDRLLLVPRGGFKSSIDIADCVQWIVCWPEVTILILTGRYDLASDFVGELRSHFLHEQIGLLNKKPLYGPKTMVDGSKSAFQILFPEHCINVNDGSQFEFVSPCRRIVDREPTVMAGGIEQALSGWHFGVMKLDDVVTNENSQTLTRMQAVNKQISIDRAMLHPYGFFDKIGTWYDENDTYGQDISSEEKLIRENQNPTIKIHLRAAWWPKKEAEGKIEEELTEQDRILWFPQRLTYDFLKNEQRKDPEGFAIKYLNDPRLVHAVKFPRELLIRRTINANMLPPSGMIVTAVDTAYSIKNFADYTVILTALIHGGRFYIIDMNRGRFNDIELPAMIAQAGYKWKPKRIAIEDSVGVRWMNREIHREMDKLGISIPIEYVPLGVGNKTKSKEIKAKPVLRLLGDERMFFANSCQGLDELYSELEKFPAGTHDDIVSALSVLVHVFGAFADMDARLHSVQADYVADRKAKEIHDRIYCLGKYNRFNSFNGFEEDNPMVRPGSDFISEEPADQDPLEELLG